MSDNYNTYHAFLTALQTPLTLDDEIRLGLVDLFDENGDTLLTLAAWRGDVENCVKLIDAGWDPEKPNEEGRCPVDIARGEGFDECASIIEKKILERHRAALATPAALVSDVPDVAPKARTRL